MPEKLEKVLRQEAEEKFPNDAKKQNAYIYGTLRKIGWTPGNKKRKIHRGSRKEKRNTSTTS